MIPDPVAAQDIARRHGVDEKRLRARLRRMDLPWHRVKLCAGSRRGAAPRKRT
jgi:hypothetical protein